MLTALILICSTTMTPMHAPECGDHDTCAIRVRHSDHMLHECSSVSSANISGARTWPGRPGQDYLRPQRRDCTCALAFKRDTPWAHMTAAT